MSFKNLDISKFERVMILKRKKRTIRDEGPTCQNCGKKDHSGGYGTPCPNCGKTLPTKEETSNA